EYHNKDLLHLHRAAARIQASARRATDPIGPCIRLAGALLPTLVEATGAARVLQAAKRGAWLRNGHQIKRNAAVELQRVVKMALSLREERVELQRVVKMALSLREVQAGQLRAAAAMLSSLPVLSRIVAARGIDAVLGMLNAAAAELRSVGARGRVRFPSLWGGA
ncbi:hypothetical protein T484DRAFT_1797842, partial [Baffinella frigidus]